MAAMIDKTAMSSAAEPPASRQGSALSRAEAEGKRDEFREAMRRDAGEKGTPGRPEDGPGREAGRKMGPRDEKADPALPPPFSGDALLRGLGGSYALLETQAAASDAPALAAELAERILVDADNRIAGGEVRITLKESVLPDTEILLRQEGERLVVQLASGNPASLDALRLAQEDLRDKLLALDRDVSVEVLDNRNQENGDSGHSGRRSRGLDYFSGSER